MVYFYGVKQTFHVLELNHGFAMFWRMEVNCHKLDNFFFSFQPYLHEPPIMQKNLDPN
jgi:hypothetical protein